MATTRVLCVVAAGNHIPVGTKSAIFSDGVTYELIAVDSLPLLPSLDNTSAKQKTYGPERKGKGGKIRRW